MVQTSTEWQLDVSRGPGCVIVRPHDLDRKLLAKAAKTADDSESADLTLTEIATLADDVWAILEKHLTYRVVLDMHEVVQLTSRLLGQLVALQSRVYEHGGTVRVCGLSPSNENVLDITDLRSRIPCYDTPGEAVLGRSKRPAHPR